MANGKKLQWLTYIVNMLVAMPVMGLISCGVFFLGYQLIYPRGNPPLWAEIAIPALLDILFTTMYGIHQYRNIILERREIRRINNTALLGGIVLFCVVFFVGISILGQGKVNDPLGELLVMAIIVTVPAFFVVWLFRRLHHSTEGWYWNVLLYLLSIGYVVFTCGLSGAVFAICQFDIWAKERTFFWNTFRDAFLRTDNLQKAADFMLTPAVHGDVSQCIAFILLEYKVKGILLSIAGGIILTVVFLLMFIARKWKFRAWFTALGLSCGLFLLGFGCYNSRFGAATEFRLNNHLAAQEQVMRAMKTVKPAFSSDEILLLIDNHKRKREFGDNGWRLMEQIEGKQNK